MTNTKFNYYKTIKWHDIYTFKKYETTTKVFHYWSNKDKLNKLTNKVIMRKLVKQFRKDNKLGNSINLISCKEPYFY